MKRRYLIIALTASTVAVAAKSANALGVFDFLNGEPAPTAPVEPAPPNFPAAADVPIASEASSEFQDVYAGAPSLTREQLARLKDGQVSHWSDLASKPYGRLPSTDGLEHYYFQFGFGEGGVILVCNTEGVMQSWDFSTGGLPQYQEPDMSQWRNYTASTAAIAVARAPQSTCP